VPVTGPCADCGSEATGTGVPLRCRPCARLRMRAIQRRCDSLRRGAKPSRSYPMTIRDLGNRDGWRCHLCRRRVDKDLPWPNSASPSFDHLIPVSAGGDDEPENLALAHLGCNSRRGARGIVQLALVG
jgi:5-methylcytosine-specific restriction endonuclease McrA